MASRRNTTKIPPQRAGEPTDVMTWIEGIERDDPAFAAMVAEEKKRLNLGDRIRKIREDQGLTQAEVARRAFTSQSMVARIESGSHDNLRIETLLRLARALGLELEIELRRSKKRSGRALRTV